MKFLALSGQRYSRSYREKLKHTFGGLVMVSVCLLVSMRLEVFLLEFESYCVLGKPTLYITCIDNEGKYDLSSHDRSAALGRSNNSEISLY